jgi:hypothetical protein
MMETSAQEQLESLMPVARIISPATIPEDKSFPPRTLFVIFGFIGSVAISLVLVFVFEQLDPGFRSAEQVERALRVPVLASVPMVRGSLAKGHRLSNYILKNPNSAFAESIRSIYMRVTSTRRAKGRYHRCRFPKIGFGKGYGIERETWTDGLAVRKN